MKSPSQKREAGLLDATPEKRSYWSIINDYGLETGLCELIDNAIDLSRESIPRKKVAIDISLDWQRQLIAVNDNAGGVKEEDLRLLVAPGASSNLPEGETIGIFGVGSKRAVVALAETISIKTRYLDRESYQIDISKDWLDSPDWHIPHSRIPDLPKGVTYIELSALRKTIAEDDEAILTNKLGAIYESFLGKDCSITINGKRIRGISFSSWAYPKSYLPRRVQLEVPFDGFAPLRVEITSGLIRDRDPAKDNYGVYVYCNDRLVCRDLKTRDVGYFVSTEAGVPHPDASLCRAIVRINGPARLMPWNSSKSGINSDHPAFLAIRPTLISLVSYFSSLSRRLKDDWEKAVFRHDSGSIERVDAQALSPSKRLILPALPRVNKAYVEHLKAQNKKELQDKPWTLGLVEAMAAVDTISRQKLETKNRIALILLDSNFEIALKEFIVHRTDLFPTKSTNISHLFERRNRVLACVQSQIAIDKTLVSKAEHYYGLRNKLIHERATVDVLGTDVENYRDTVEKILALLFGLKF